jgi:hypothetical protein
MARARRVVYSHRYRQPSLLNDLLFRFKNLNPLTKLEFPMATSRRNIIIRSIASIVGDITVGVAFASAAVWIIESAALGLFLSFLVWLIAGIAALAFSQHVFHPTAKVVLSDQKLDMACNAITGLAARLNLYTRSLLPTT